MIRSKLASRSYTSVSVFSAELVKSLSADLGVDAADAADFQAQTVGRAIDMSYEQREKRKLAKRILKAVQPALADALRKESELNGRPYAQQIKEMDAMFPSRRGSLADSLLNIGLGKDGSTTNGIHPGLHQREDVNVLDELNDGAALTMADQNDSPQDVEMADGNDDDGLAARSVAQLNGELTAADHNLAAHTPPASTNGIRRDADIVLTGAKIPTSPAREPPTPPISQHGSHQPGQVEGGIPWYVEQFDPEGTTIYEERWTGPEVLREMSEELSEMDEDELEGLAAVSIEADEKGRASGAKTNSSPLKKSGLKKNGKRRRRWTGFK
jgi:NuA3 HAT complex component NTO1